MNNYMTAQIANMKLALQTFEQACKIAAMKDDGRISKEEEKELRKIHTATIKYEAELNKVR